MPRIRTVKPEFFRHEGLQELEIANPGAYVMLVFEGLWTQADKAGRFEWRPRQLKLDILPFLPYDMENTLRLLLDAGYLKRYEVGGKPYGLVISFPEHQRINGKEKQESPRYPAPPEVQPEKKPRRKGSDQGSTGEAPEKQPRSQEKEREKEKEEERITEDAARVSTRPAVAPTPTSKEKYLAGVDAWFGTIAPADWAKAYPALNIVAEAERARLWLHAHTDQRKLRIQAFLLRWFNRAQDQASRGGPMGTSARPVELHRQDWKASHIAAPKPEDLPSPEERARLAAGAREMAAKLARGQA